MLELTVIPAGVLITRPDDTGSRLFVMRDELPAFIADLIAQSAEQDDASSWDTYCWLQGNPMETAPKPRRSRAGRQTPV